MVGIKGLEKFAPKDFPGFIASSVFLGGCNFRCSFCHNSDLVLRPHLLPTLPMDYFISYLDSRRGWLEGVCISGGEPLLEEDLEVLLRVIKDRGLLIKLDTNGSFPEKLEDLIRDGLVDRVAMDIKAPLEKYRETVRADVRVEDIVRSTDIIRNSGLPYVFRTTVVPGIIEDEDIVEIGRLLEGAKEFRIQQFSPRNTMDERLRQVAPYTRDRVKELAALVKPFFSEVRLEGV